MRTAIILGMLMCAMSARAEGLFSAEERARLVAFWNEPGRVRVGALPEAAQRGPWQVRLTPEGSTWLLKYQIAVGAASAPPTQEATASAAPQTEVWKTWVRSKIAFDRWQAQQNADSANGMLTKPPSDPASPQALLGNTKPDPPSAAKDIKTPAAPPFPGPIPPELLSAAGNPPPLASAVAPLLTTVTFADNEAFPYPSHIALPPGFAYYRFPQGTVAYGPGLKDLPASEVDALFVAAGLNPSEQRIALSVSKLEGGFESVNTYDTGYVSVGFIQFITLDDGKHSLSEVLQSEKNDRPGDFGHDFHYFGIDVSPEGIFTVVDPTTGAELSGADAVRRTVEDKRLAAVFQRAGRHSTSFRAAQIRVAKAHYWPSEDAFNIVVGGMALTGKVSDVLKSEAGIATLFDRKVNRGSIAPFADVLTKVMTAHNLTRLADVAPFEKEIIAGLKYRTDYLKDPTLSQPK